MQKLLLRLDDASEYMDYDKWKRMEEILDKYNVKPLFGIIPANEDPNLLKYGKVDCFWELVHSWISKGWVPALHGYTHVFETESGGINPVNKKSEYAGVTYERQLQKIRNGVLVLKKHGIDPKVFFAPAHTFDENTLKALVNGSSIRIVSDTPASDVYCRHGITFVPQQSGRVRKIKLKTITYCYHPNTTTEDGFKELDSFLSEKSFCGFPLEETTRELSIFDRMIMKVYYWRHK